MGAWPELAAIVRRDSCEQAPKRLDRRAEAIGRLDIVIAIVIVIVLFLVIIMIIVIVIVSYSYSLAN